MTVRILAAADLHLGRRPTGFPPDLGSRISPATALERLVDAAISHDVHLLLLAGDLVDRRNASNEAWGPLDRALRRLREAGIATVAVAGNHDAEALPLIAREVGEGHLVLLGEGGRWERWTLPGPGGAPLVHVDGWSFPQALHPSDPTEHWAPTVDDDVATIGLLHCDLDAMGSRHAPVAGSRLRALGHDAWVLGHIHTPALHAVPGAAPLIYPGSPQGLDPGERGVHGAHLLEVAGRVVRDMGRVSLAAGRYERLSVDLEGVESVDTLDAHLRTAIGAYVAGAAEETPGVVALHLRLRLTGRTPLLGALEERVAALGDFDPGGAHGVRVVIDPRASVEVRPAHDLERLADEDDAPGLLARLVLGLENDPAEWLAADRLRAAMARELAGIAGQSLLQEMGLRGEPDDAELRERLKYQASRILDTLLDQGARR